MAQTCFTNCCQMPRHLHPEANRSGTTDRAHRDLRAGCEIRRDTGLIRFCQWRTPGRQGDGKHRHGRRRWRRAANVTAGPFGSPRVRSRMPVRCPRPAIFSSVPPQVCSTSSRCAAIANMSRVEESIGHKSIAAEYETWQPMFALGQPATFSAFTLLYDGNGAWGI